MCGYHWIIYESVQGNHLMFLAVERKLTCPDRPVKWRNRSCFAQFDTWFHSLRPKHNRRLIKGLHSHSRTTTWVQAAADNVTTRFSSKQHLCILHRQGLKAHCKVWVRLPPCIRLCHIACVCYLCTMVHTEQNKGCVTKIQQEKCSFLISDVFVWRVCLSQGYKPPQSAFLCSVLFWSKAPRLLHSHIKLSKAWKPLLAAPPPSLTRSNPDSRLLLRCCTSV